MITVFNQSLVVTLDATLGGGICQIVFDGDALLAYYDWDTPVGSSRSRTYSDTKLDWLSEYRGGWQLLVPNAGAACLVDDVPLPFHGELSRTRVDVVDASPSGVSMRAGTRLPFVVQRIVQVLDGPARVRITTTIENVTDDARPFIWGEHPAFLASPGDRIDLDAGPVTDAADPNGTSTIWPSSTTDERGIDEVPTNRPLESVHYLPDRPGGWAALRRAHIGVAMIWELADFPHLWLWREIGSAGFRSSAGPRSSRSSRPARRRATGSPLPWTAGRPTGWGAATNARRW